MRMNRRTLIAALGATASTSLARSVGGTSDEGKSENGLPTNSLKSVCESKAVAVPELKALIGTGPGTADSAWTSVYGAFELGLNYKNAGKKTLDPNKVKSKIESNYKPYFTDPLPQRIKDQWCLLVLQAFILGNLSRNHWLKKGDGNPGSFNDEHVRGAQTMFDQAISPEQCEKHLTEGWYVLPGVPPDDASGSCKNIPLRGNLRILQIGSGCVLCSG